MRLLKRHTNYILLSLALLLYGLSQLIHYYEKSINTADNIIKNIESVLHKKEAFSSELLNELIKEENPDSLFIKYNDARLNEINDRGIYLYFYRNDSLLYWSSNDVSVPASGKKSVLDKRFVRFGNGWYEVVTKQKENLKFYALILVKHEFAYQNKYLKNAFQSDFKIDDNNVLAVEEPFKVPLIRAQDGTPLFSLVIYHLSPYIEWLNSIEVGLIICSIFLISVVFLRLSKSITVSWKKTYRYIFFVTLISILKVGMTYFHFPAPLYNLPLFSPAYYASSFLFNSLGDFLINSIILLLFVYHLRKNLFGWLQKNLNNSLLFKTIVISILAVSVLGFIELDKLFSGLIENSTISFDLNNLFDLDMLSYAALVAAYLMLFTHAFLVESLLLYLKEKLSTSQLAVFSGIILTLFIAIAYGLFNISTGALIFCTILILLPVFSNKKYYTEYSFGYLVLFIAAGAFYFSQSIIVNTEKRENSQRRILVEKLSVEVDPIAEQLFNDIEKSIQFDTTLIKALVIPVEKNQQIFDTKKLLQQKYFNGYWEKYDLDVYLYNRQGEPVFESRGYTSSDISVFETTISRFGKRTSGSKYFYYVNNINGRAQYIARIPVKKKSRHPRILGYVFFRLEAKYLSKEIGFPELLLDKRTDEKNVLSDYSYAKYKNYVLLTHYGDCPYPLTSAGITKTDEQEYFINRDGYNHLVLNKEGTQLLVSVKTPAQFSKLTIFSTLFLFFGLCTLLISASDKIINGFNLTSITLKGRIQIQLLVVLLVSFILLGWGTIESIQTQYRNKNVSYIKEKIQSVLINLEDVLANEKSLKNFSKDYLNYLLSKYSNIFYTDVNIYDRNGTLVATSRPQITQQGLSGIKINNRAYYHLKNLDKTELINEENIGNLTYTSAYVPLKNSQNKLLGYLNLPYFAKQHEVEHEISGFLITLINIYLLLLAIAVTTAIFISNRITQPLQIVKEKIGKVQLGKSNELIDWKGNDEIGKLVAEYNRMVVDLVNSAEMLAKSEREGAWKEMAKQVAHEIKNPLTPMKLSVQLLQRSWKDGAPDFNQRLDRFTNTMIEQIDTLSSIATAFSNFAKMPAPQLEPCDMVSIINTALSLYKATSDVSIKSYTELNEAIVNGDKEQLIRILNNLIKNAIQSIPEDRAGEVTITLSQENSSFLLEIKDNGSGIADDIKDKIFFPNFTTKSTGMGLGLAMVKNMLENMNGTISFITSPNMGTIFKIVLPVYYEEV